MTKPGTNSRSRSRSKLSSFQVPTYVANALQEQGEGESHKNDGPRTVAIVGAGFAGLVLANYLELYLQDQQQEKNGNGVVPENTPWNYRIFESKSSSGIPVIGTICLESARQVLEELRLFEQACTEHSTRPVFPQLSRSKSTSMKVPGNDHRYHEVSRESFLELLRKNVKIQPSSRVVDIHVKEFTGASKYFVVIQGDNGERVTEGPFDLVVASNGLSFRGGTTKSMQQRLKSSASIVKIGDSRYRYGRSWWQFDFLGMTRRTSGANTAILEGLEVGRRLLQNNSERNPIRSDKVWLPDIALTSLQNDSGRTLYSKGNLVWMIVVILLPILLALAFYY